jgi:hypothetical protein
MGQFFMVGNGKFVYHFIQLTLSLQIIDKLTGGLLEEGLRLIGVIINTSR